ncbi:hypothetical protein EVAR_90089_1 [Eumeta japonica]|uniref:Uncharacterized protein n=1 Tax=Eumeta variegata TaxID=151549 RepID=A0A4C1WY79_EUMVA|nr:hypothetical protein EVAR_90089_1 [Eumeta japonica]
MYNPQPIPRAWTVTYRGQVRLAGDRPASRGSSDCVRTVDNSPDRPLNATAKPWPRARAAYPSHTSGTDAAVSVSLRAGDRKMCPHLLISIL